MFNWQQIISPDIFVKSCTFVNHYGVPSNTFGFSYPKNGNAYIGLGLLNLPYETKEYIYQQLTVPLITGKSYYTSFFVSKADRTVYSIKNIGANFSVTQPTLVSIQFISSNPQIQNQSGFLTDTIGWTKIEGYFTAQGGEQYITIGNFNSNANTDTINSGTNNPIPFDNGTAYYYVDSVSLYDSLDYALITNIKKMEDMVNVKLYPNPTTSKLKLSIQNLKNEQLSIKITDVLGREIKTLEYEEEIDLSDLENGIYFLSFYQNKQVLTTKKIIKQ
ncbi:MAG: T9SS type A sorting domain-containing protein [Bacteroidia bacterium]|nr:T9SS type A sorting domain-containing protein [Bacteroidia bacterium]